MEILHNPEQFMLSYNSLPSPEKIIGKLWNAVFIISVSTYVLIQNAQVCWTLLVVVEYISQFTLYFCSVQLKICQKRAIEYLPKLEMSSSKVRSV